MPINYIYTILQSLPRGSVELELSTTRKWVAQNHIREHFINAGYSISPLTIARSKDGSDQITYIDPYEFMDIDMGEL